jgi:hypothetical protein
MLDYYDIVYDTFLKAYGRVVGNWDNRNQFTPETSRYLAVSFLHSNNPNLKVVDAAFKSATKNLIPLKKGSVVVVKPDSRLQGQGLPLGVVKGVHDGYVTVYNGNDYDRVWFYELGETFPQGTPIETFTPGQLVYLAIEPNFIGVVKEILPNPYPVGADSYRVLYFNKANISSVLEHGVTTDGTTVDWPSWKLAACTEFPTPRIKRSATEIRRIKTGFKTALNSKNSPYMDRHDFHNPTRKLWAQTYKLRGQLIARAFAAQHRDDHEWLLAHSQEVVEVFNEMNESRRRHVWTKSGFGNWASQDSILDWCGHCNSVEIYDEMNYSEDSGLSFCRNCDSDFVWSDYMSDYIMRHSAVPVYESMRNWRAENPDGYATPRWARNRSGFYFADDVLMDEDTYNEWDAEYNQDDDYEDDEDRYDATGGQLNGYHNSRRDWVEQWSDKSYIPIGVELEVYCEDRYNAVKELREKFPKKMYLERDGSLDDDHGFEIVSQPFGKKEWTELAPQILNTLKKRGAVAWNEPAGEGYGIHINLSRKYLTPLQETRMFMFLAAEENRDFVTAIAQRASVYHPTLDMGKTEKLHQKVRNMGGLDTKDYRTNMYGESIPVRKLVGRGKYAPMNMHTERIEIRIFQSTLNLSSFMKNLEFTWALVDWTNLKSSTGTSWVYQDFLRWLAKRPHVERDFPHLMAYLRKPKFDLRDDDRVRNAWLKFLPKETRRSIPAAVLEKTPTEHVEDIYVPVITPPTVTAVALAA